MRIILTILLLLFIIGCNTNNKESILDPTNYSPNNNSTELTKVSESKGIDQHVTNRAKEILSGREDLTSMKAANSNDKLIVAIEPLHHKRFKLNKLRKEIKEELQSEFPQFKIEISTDKKIYLELEKLENDIKNQGISKKELHKRINKIQKLDDEQT